MKTKLIIIALFAGAFGLLLTQKNKIKQVDPIRPVDTIKVISDYINVYQDSINCSIACTWETYGTPFYRAHEERLERQERERDRLVILASKKLKPVDFEVVMNKITR